MSSGTKKIEAPEISSGGVIGKVRKSESRKSKRIGKRKEDLYSGKIFFHKIFIRVFAKNSPKMVAKEIGHLFGYA